ncbi:MAG: helix-turn-helix domain-containing protein [Clostridia bacterium]|nr:helix-turn-helix domain-containing protein [Clostridia bacterium]
MLTDVQKEILKKFADCDLKVSRTSTAMFMAQGTVNYHLREIKRKTGLNPRSFWDLIKLLEGVRRDEN